MLGIQDVHSDPREELCLRFEEVQKKEMTGHERALRHVSRQADRGGKGEVTGIAGAARAEMATMMGTGGKDLLQGLPIKMGGRSVTKCSEKAARKLARKVGGASNIGVR